MKSPKRIHIIFSIKNDGRGNPSPTANCRLQTTDNIFAPYDNSFLQSRK